MVEINSIPVNLYMAQQGSGHLKGHSESGEIFDLEKAQIEEPSLSENLEPKKELKGVMVEISRQARELVRVASQDNTLLEKMWSELSSAKHLSAAISEAKLKQTKIEQNHQEYLISKRENMVESKQAEVLAA